MVRNWNEFWSNHPRALAELWFWGGVAFYGSMVLGAWVLGIKLVEWTS